MLEDTGVPSRPVCPPGVPSRRVLPAGVPSCPACPAGVPSRCALPAGMPSRPPGVPSCSVCPVGVSVDIKLFQANVIFSTFGVSQAKYLGHFMRYLIMSGKCRDMSRHLIYFFQANVIFRCREIYGNPN